MLPQLDKNTHKFRIKLFSCSVYQFISDAIRIHSFSVDPIGTHSVKSIRNSCDPCLFRYLSSFQPPRITRTVIAFMMRKRDIRCRFDHDFVFEYLRSHRRVGFDDTKFYICQPVWTVKNRIRNTDLADIMKQRRIAQVIDTFLIPAQ